MRTQETNPHIGCHLNYSLLYFKKKC